MKSTETQRILVFGGSFNPPTLAHEEIMEACLDLPDFSELWIMPSGDRIDKQMGVEDSDRLAMLHLVKQDEFENNPRLRISDFEFHLPRPTQTYKTVAALAIAHSDLDFWYVFGGDSYQSMPTWDEGLELQRLLHMVLFARANTPLPTRPGIIPLRLHDYGGLSSTEVRSAVMEGRSIEGFVCQSVGRYIQEKRLYTSAALKA